MALESEVADKLKKFLAEVSIAGHPVKVFLTDNRSEVNNADIQKVLNGIEHRLAMPYSAEQNGCAERENHTLVEAVCLMLAAKELPKSLWAAAVQTASYILNRTGKSSVERKTPYELWYGRKGSFVFLVLNVLFTFQK